MAIRIFLLVFILANLASSKNILPNDGHSISMEDHEFGFGEFMRLITFQFEEEGKINKKSDEEKANLIRKIEHVNFSDEKGDGNHTALEVLVAYEHWKEVAREAGINVKKIEDDNFAEHFENTNNPEKRKEIMKRGLIDPHSAILFIDAFAMEQFDILLDRHFKGENLNISLNANITFQDIHKRSVRDIGRGLKKAASTARSVIKSVGTTVKAGIVKAKQFLSHHFNKVKALFSKLKTKVSKAVSRAKAVFKKAKKNKYVRFMNATLSVVWEKIPQEVKDKAVNKALSLVLGGEGDVNEGMQEEGFNPDEFEDDDELAENLMEESDLVEDENAENVRAFQDLRDFMVNPTPNVGIYENNCCIQQHGEIKDAEDYEDGDAEILEEVDDSLAVSEADFSPESLDEMKIDTSDLSDMGDNENLDDFDENFINSITKRSHVIKKRCPCSGRAMIKREIIHARKASQNKKMMPSLIDAANPGVVQMILKKIGVKNFENICNNKEDQDCIQIEGVRMAALSGLTSLRVLCPLCDLELVSATESSPNPFLKGWTWVLMGTESLSVFLMEAYSDYGGQPELFDANKNRFKLIKITEDKWNWEYLIHE